ncbi:hypothetical protein BKA64DRAFT_704059 [Cadophora sp. MPI-SDFR-AT-0126]|nr:hypothetical protein BKA64DRAFT_704059 [Leotiomycetes sp. MPI-SDFR-AT-0126]
MQILKLFVLATLVNHSICDTITVQAEKLVDFTGCTNKTTEPQDIRDAWDSAMDLAYVSSGKIEWGHHPSVDFLAGPHRNAAYHNIIKAVLNNAYTFRRRYWWNPPAWRAWKTSIRCDDIDGTCAKFSKSAPAYTINPGPRPGKTFQAARDTIVICPKIFKQKQTCAEGIKNHASKSERSDLGNFQCRVYQTYQREVMLKTSVSSTNLAWTQSQPGTSNISFEVRTVLSSSGDGASRSISASTKSLPSGGSISKVSYRKSGDIVIYNADMLVPYASVRLFIGGPHKAVSDSAGWPIDAGMSTENSGGDPVVQGQGYAPIKNAFGGSLRSYKCAGEPCDDNPDYDCKGSTLCTTPDLLKWCDLAVNN